MTEEPRYREWDVEGREKERLEWLGTTSIPKGSIGPIFFDPRTSEVFRTAVDEEEERLIPVEESIRSTEESSLSAVIRDIGEEFGWETLSEFGTENRD